jgi:hypothetical protein
MNSLTFVVRFLVEHHSDYIFRSDYYNYAIQDASCGRAFKLFSEAQKHLASVSKNYPNVRSMIEPIVC